VTGTSTTSSFLLFFSFLPIYLRIFLDCARKSPLCLCVSLKQRFSCFSHFADVLQFFSFFFDALPFFFARTISLFSFSENFHPRPRGRGSPQLDFPHFAYFLLHSLPLHLRVSAVARILSSGLSPHTTAATFALFFQYDGFLRSVRVDFFLIRSRIRVHPPCIKVSS